MLFYRIIFLRAISSSFSFVASYLLLLHPKTDVLCVYVNSLSKKKLLVPLTLIPTLNYTRKSSLFYATALIYCPVY